MNDRFRYAFNNTMKEDTINKIERQIARDKKVEDLEVQMKEILEKLELIISILSLKAGKK